MRLRNVFKEHPHGVLFLRDYPLGGKKRSMANETNTRWAVPAGEGVRAGPTVVGVQAGRGPAASWRRDEGEAAAAPHPVLLEVGQRKEMDYGGMAENSKQIIMTIKQHSPSYSNQY